MGRHRKAASADGDVRKQEHVTTPHPAVERRLGLTRTVCVDCDATNPANADACRKCNGGLRPKAAQYRDE